MVGFGLIFLALVLAGTRTEIRARRMKALVCGSAWHDARSWTLRAGSVSAYIASLGLIVALWRCGIGCGRAVRRQLQEIETRRGKDG
jgi:hypothetical protein